MFLGAPSLAIKRTFGRLIRRLRVTEALKLARICVSMFDSAIIVKTRKHLVLYRGLHLPWLKI